MATRVEILCAMWIQLASTCVRTALNVIRRKTRPLKLRASEISIPKTRRFERRRKLTEIRRLIIRSMLDFLTSPTTLLLGANKLGSGLRFLRSWDLIVRGYSVCAPGAATIENRKNRRLDPDLRICLRPYRCHLRKSQVSRTASRPTAAVPRQGLAARSQAPERCDAATPGWALCTETYNDCGSDRLSLAYHHAATYRSSEK